MVSIKTIDAKTLARMFLAGARNLEAKKEWINEALLKNLTWKLWQRLFLPAPFAAQEETQALFFPSF